VTHKSDISATSGEEKSFPGRKIIGRELEPGGRLPGDRSLIAHLFRRAAFGATPAVLKYYAARSYGAAVEDLVRGKSIAGAPPSFDQTLDPVNDLVFNVGTRNPFSVPSLDQIQTTWVERMVTTTVPLVERMTLFLHNHWATAYRPGDSVDTPELQTQNNVFRDNALGNWSTLCHSMIEDVALSCWLNNNVNVKAHPNENLAREFMELFTLGPGNYTETDVREAARALTGYRFAYNLQGTDPVNEAMGPRYVMIFDPTQHDDGDISIFGSQAAPMMPHQFVDLALSQAAAPMFLARKLAQTFVTPDPSPDFVGRIAASLTANKWELAPALRTIFSSFEFRSEAARSAVVRSPTEYMIGILRALNRTSSDDYSVALYWMNHAGQELYNPPNVGGWPKNMGWLGAGGVLARYNAGVTFADRHVRSTTLPGQTRLRSTTPQGWGEIFGITNLAQATVDAMNGYLNDPTASTDQNVTDAAMITLVLASPDYMLA